MHALPQAVLDGLVEGTLLAMVALGLTLVFGIARFPNVAHGEFLTVASYVTWWAAQAGLFLPVAAVLGCAATVPIALLSYRYVFRPLASTPATCLITSIGLSLLLRNVIAFVFGTGQQAFDVPLWRAWRLGGLLILPIDLLIAAISILAIFCVHLLLKHSRIGLEMRAVADDPTLARTGGLRPDRVHVVMWSVAASLAGLAGILLGAKTVVFPELGWTMLLPAFAAAILGGLGSPYGAILAGILIGITQNVATIWISDAYKETLSFVALIAVLLLRPQGLTGRVEAAR